MTLAVNQNCWFHSTLQSVALANIFLVKIKLFKKQKFMAHNSYPKYAKHCMVANWDVTSSTFCSLLNWRFDNFPSAFSSLCSICSELLRELLPHIFFFKFKTLLNFMPIPKKTRNVSWNCEHTFRTSVPTQQNKKIECM